MSDIKNPFSKVETDCHEIWDMLVRRDIEAFVSADWDAHKADFIEESFFGLDAGKKQNPDGWRMAYPNLATYGDKWLETAKKSLKKMPANALKKAQYEATLLRDIEVNGDIATAHKKFDYWIEYSNGEREHLNWQTLYFCHKKNGKWWIFSFIGFLPNPMGSSTEDIPLKYAPVSEQHVTAGSYSPALEITPGKLVVICGQAALDLQGKIVGKNIEEQTRATLENCRTQLKAAGCTMADVFKVNVYLTNLNDWQKFNDIYEGYMPEPRPVRTVVQVGLLGEFMVEVEMWAVKQ